MTRLANASDAYRQQGEKYIELLAKIRSLSGNSKGDTGLADGEYERLDLRARTYRRTTCDPHYRVALAGGFSTGKSELLNAFLDNSVLPSQIRDTTFVPTVIRRAKDGVRRNLVRYLTHEEIAVILTQYRDFCADHAVIPTSAEAVQYATEENLTEVLRSLATKLQDREVKDLSNFFQALRKPKFQEYLRHEHPYERVVEEREVREIVIRRPTDSEKFGLERYLAASAIIDMPSFPFPEDVELIDLPGTDAGDRWAKQVTHRFVRDVDMMLLVVKADAIFSDAAQDLFAAVRDWVGGHTERLFVVVNKADLYAGFEPENISGAYTQLIDGIRSSIPNYTPQIIYVSAAAALESSEAHESAIRSIKAIAETNNTELNKLLRNVRDGGGVTVARKFIETFLSESAFNVKSLKMQRGWEEIYDSVPAEIVAEIPAARKWLTNQPEQIAERCRESLNLVKKSVESSVATLKVQLRDAMRAKEQSRDGMRAVEAQAFEKLSEEIRGKAAKLCIPSTEKTKALRYRDALEVCRGEWPDLYERFREVLFTESRVVVRDFESPWRTSFGPPMEALRRFHACGLGLSGPELPVEPFAKLCESITLRLNEVVPTVSDVPRPYPQPLTGESFGEYEDQQSNSARFHRSVQAFFSAKIDAALAELRKVVKLYADWHLDSFLKAVWAHVKLASTSRELLTDPARFSAFLADAEDQSVVARNKQITEIGDLYGMLRRTQG